MQENEQQSPDGRVPMGQKIAWGMGGMADNLMGNSIMQLALPIYNIALGVNPFLISIALGIPRLWDAVTDPLMGNISDNTRSRWGRRRPYIAVGAVMTGLLFALLWMPPAGLGERGLFGYFCLLSLLYFTAYTIFVIPQNALGFELSTDYNERTRVMAYRSFFSSVGGLLLPWTYKLCFRPEFGANEAQGVRVVGVIFGVIMIACGLVPALFCRENRAVMTQAKIRLGAAFKYTLQNRSFLILAGAVFTILVGLFIVAPFGTYINIYYVYGGDKEAAATLGGVGGTVYAVMGLACVPLVSWLATRWGKRKTLLVGQGLVIGASLLSWFLYSPQMPYLQLVSLVITCPGLTCVWVLTGSMLADVCDVDELNCGLRREGMYGAVFSWVFKGGIGAVMVLSGYMVQMSGFDAALEAAQSPQTIFRLRLMFALIPAVCLTISSILIQLFPITEASARAVRRQLDERKKESQPATEDEVTGGGAGPVAEQLV